MVHYKNSFLKPTEDFRNLQLLEEVARDSDISQRKLASKLGLALGVTNACLKKMARKGHIKMKGINHKRIAYYITPEGFSEKSRLTYHFLQHTVHYYVTLKNNITSKLDLISGEGVKKLVFYGAGEVMEVAYVCLCATDLKLIGIIDDSPSKQGKRVFNFCIQSPESVKSLDVEAILITSIRYKEKMLNYLKENKEFKNIKFYHL
ncbi:MAG: winged helix-turn-helix transcriptional regulator [Candidatus Omnitrophota bacterium]